MGFPATKVTAVLFAALSMASGSASGATLNECKLPDGRTVLLWESCPQAGQQPSSPPSASPKAPAAPAAAPKSETPRKAPATPGVDSKGKSNPGSPIVNHGIDLRPKGGAAPFAPTQSDAQLEKEMVIEILSGYTVCSSDVEGFKAKYAAAFDFWKLRNTAGIARIKADPAAQRIIDRRIAEAGQVSPGRPDPDKTAYCETLIGPFLQGRFAGSTPR